jgi:hypothetical protein
MTTNSKIKLNLDSLKSRREWKRHKVKDGHNIYRILPPFGETSNGYPYRKWQIIWGLTDPESGRARPFASSMTAEKRCPVTEFVAQLKKRAETMKAQLQASGVSEEDTKARLKDLNELVGNITPKTVYIYNAADKSGEVGLLELKSTAHKDIKTEMNQYIQDYNQDPTSLGSADDDSGVWFDIQRTGEGFKTEYKAEKFQTRVKNASGISFIDDRSPLPEAVVENYNNLAYDLSSVYQLKTYDQLLEVLNYNLPGIVDMVPDADLTVEPTLSAATPVTKLATNAAPTKTAAKPASRVTTRLDDEDDVDAVALNGAAKKATGSTTLDADFAAEADRILNG